MIRALAAALLAAVFAVACVPAPPRPTEPPSASSPADGPDGPTTSARVVRVVDGDTIAVEIDGARYTVRYIGIDTPETVKPNAPVEPFGEAASAANRELVGGRSVVLERDVSETDRYGRLLRHVWLAPGEGEGSGWLLVGERLLERGLAQVVTYPPDVKYIDERFLPAQARARQAGLGIWSDETPAPSTGGPTGCEPAYLPLCVPAGSIDLDCADIAERDFPVRSPDPHRFDHDGDGRGCEG
jgi:micrococcal nuclease